MSFTDTRVLIATALDSVTGLAGHTFRPAVVKSGSAWPTLNEIDRGPGDAWSTSWDLTIVLGSDERVASSFLDELWPELVDELEVEGVCYVSGPAVTAALTISGNNVQALTVRVVAD